MGYLIIFLPLIIAALIFTVSLVLFLKAKKQPELMAKRKMPFIVSTILFSVVAGAYIGIAVFFSLAITFM